MIVVDSSAIVAVAMNESESDLFSAVISTNRSLVAAPTALECHLVLSGRAPAVAGRFMDVFLARDAVELVPFDTDLYEIARRAFDTFGRGRHAAALNFGDCFAYALANKYPDKVKAVVGIEPSGALDAEKVSIAGLKQVPLLFVWGDKIRETPRWVQIQGALKKMIAAQKAQGGQADEFDLPQMGINGNSHMIMMDRNSDQIARLVQQWMEKQGLVE